MTRVFLTSDSHVGDLKPGGLRALKCAVDLCRERVHPDVFVSVGDCTENSTPSQWNKYYNQLEDLRGKCEFIVAQGNHDIRFRPFKPTFERFASHYEELTGVKLDGYYYARTLCGVRFFVLGSETTLMEKAHLSETQLAWLERELDDAGDEPKFVICHEPLRNTHGLPYVWRTPMLNSGYVGDQSERLFELLRSRKNLFYISGHLHVAPGKLTYQELDTLHLVNLPSAGDKVNFDGDVEKPALAMTLDVYEDRAVFGAWDCVSGERLDGFDREYAFE